MSTTNSNAEKPTDSKVRDKTIPLGIDNSGSHHIYRSPTDTIHVIDPSAGERVQVVDADDRLLEGWMDSIGETLGWEEPWYGIRTVDTGKFRPRGF